VRFLLRTDNHIAGLLLRLALGIVMLPHGAQKALGMFEGPGFQDSMGYFTGTHGLPWILGFLAIMAESVGALALIFGFLTRIAALGIGGVMVAAVYLVHLDDGFFMNWLGTKSGEGFEYHILAVGIALALVLRGGGFLSIDRALSAR